MREIGEDLQRFSNECPLQEFLGRNGWIDGWPDEGMNGWTFVLLSSLFDK